MTEEGFIGATGGSAGTTGTFTITNCTFLTGNVGIYLTNGASTNSPWITTGYEITPPTPEELEAYRLQRLKETWDSKRAEVRARRLFKRVIGEILYQRYKQRGFHEVCGRSGTRYRLRPGRKVEVMEENERDSEIVAFEYCANLPGLPLYDTMISQHLMLSASRKTEEQFKSIANKFEPWRSTLNINIATAAPFLCGAAVA